MTDAGPQDNGLRRDDSLLWMAAALVLLVAALAGVLVLVRGA
ncbi:MAG TPA: hypothetical protein VJ874_01915 [Candidatus Thermoplasmatota archaeon]|nr:hypothetical protein [Candidatus Thermoplasmatota archaeon]